MCRLWSRYFKHVHPAILIVSKLNNRHFRGISNESTTNLRELALPILHDSPGLVVIPQEAERIEKDLQTRLLEQKKLSLVLDLDQTVLHATKDPSTEELLHRHTNNHTNAIRNVHRVTFADCLPGEIYYIKLRPGLEKFLQRISPHFELHIYTMGSRNYARAVVRLFDPDGKYFYNRILSRDDAVRSNSATPGEQEEATEKIDAAVAGMSPPLSPVSPSFSLSSSSSQANTLRKNLKRIFPVDDSTVLIVDDRADVWDYCANLISVPPYTFFLGVGDINSGNKGGIPVSVDDEPLAGVAKQVDAIVQDDDDYELDIIGDLLLKVHEEFFSLLSTPTPTTTITRVPDVKEILTRRKRAVLGGVNLTFSGIIPLGMPPEKFELWRLAEMFGAKCRVGLHLETTHLITFRNDTDKVLRALESGRIKIVRPAWLIGCFREWKRLDEEEFLVRGLPHPTDAAKHQLALALSAEDLEAMNAELAELEADDNNDDKSIGDDDDDNENTGYIESRPLKRSRTNLMADDLIASSAHNQNLEGEISSAESDDSLIRQLEEDLLS